MRLSEIRTEGKLDSPISSGLSEIQNGKSYNRDITELDDRKYLHTQQLRQLSTFNQTFTTEKW